MEGFNPRVMLATSAADLGIDHPNCNYVHNIDYVHNIEWPEDIATYVQRRGRGGRQNQESQFILNAGLSGYLQMVARNNRSLDVEKDDDDDDNIL